MKAEDEPDRWGTWENAEHWALEASRAATPAERFVWLQEMLEIARQSGALARALDERWEREKAMWEGRPVEQPPGK